MTDWREHAACRGTGHHAWFPSITTGRLARSQRLEREALAKDVCASCSVRAECAQVAATTPERDGIWGGLNEHERKVLA